MSTLPHPPERPSLSKAGINIDYINSFIEAMVNTFSTMLGESPVREKLALKVAGEQDYGVSGIIGMTGEASGSVVLNLGDDTARKVVGKFTGATYETVSSDVIDGVGELTNIIAGDAKNRLRARGYLFEISLPRIVAGRSYITTCPQGSPCVVIKFSSGMGKLSLEVSLRREK